jgi:hypothetical protein
MPDSRTARQSLVDAAIVAITEAAIAINERMGVQPEQPIPYGQQAMDQLGSAAVKAVLDAIAEPTDAMGLAGLIATNGNQLDGWMTEDRRAQFEALGDIGYDDRFAGNPSKWMKPIWRAMFKTLRKEIEDV